MRVASRLRRGALDSGRFFSSSSVALEELSTWTLQSADILFPLLYHYRAVRSALGGGAFVHAPPRGNTQRLSIAHSSASFASGAAGSRPRVTRSAR